MTFVTDFCHRPSDIELQIVFFTSSIASSCISLKRICLDMLATI